MSKIIDKLQQYEISQCCVKRNHVKNNDGTNNDVKKNDLVVPKLNQYYWFYYIRTLFVGIVNHDI